MKNLRWVLAIEDKHIDRLGSAFIRVVKEGMFEGESLTKDEFYFIAQGLRRAAEMLEAEG